MALVPSPSPAQLASFRARYKRGQRLVLGTTVVGFAAFIPLFLLWGDDHFTAFAALYGIYFVVQSAIAFNVRRCPRCSLVLGRPWRIERCAECGLVLEDRSRPAV